MANLYYVPQYKTTTLSVAGGIDSSQTTGIVLSSIPADVDTTKPGIVCITWADPLDTDKAEWLTYTSISATKELQGVTRGQEGYSAKAHLNGATVAWTLSKSHINNINADFVVEHNQDGTHKGALVTTLKATGAEVNTGTEDDKIVTPKAIADSLIQSGWTPARETWTYASANTITVPTGAASKYQKGDKIKLTQTTVKYFYITAVADTLLTVTGGNDYTVANAAITDNYYSKAENPQGFPHWFNYTVTTTPGGSMTYSSVTQTARFCIKGTTVFFELQTNGTTGGTASNYIRFSLPLSPSSAISNWRTIAYAGLYDGAPAGTFVQNNQANAAIDVYKYNAANYSLVAGVEIRANGFYEI